MKKYCCSFPNCTYETEKRNKIDFHHIGLRQSKNKQYANVVVALCPNHHRTIWHPKATHGMHSILNEDSLEILALYRGTNGNGVHYRNPNTNKEFYYFPKTKETWDI